MNDIMLVGRLVDNFLDKDLLIKNKGSLIINLNVDRLEDKRTYYEIYQVEIPERLKDNFLEQAEENGVIGVKGYLKKYSDDIVIVANKVTILRKGNKNE